MIKQLEQKTGYIIRYDTKSGSEGTREVKKGHTKSLHQRVRQYNTHVSVKTQMSFSPLNYSEDAVDDLGAKSLLADQGCEIVNTKSNLGEIMRTLDGNPVVELIERGLRSVWEEIILKNVPMLTHGELAREADNRKRRLKHFFDKSPEEIAAEEDICNLGELYRSKQGCTDNEFFRAIYNRPVMNDILSRRYTIGDLLDIWFR